jgi:hypothetical protein
VDWVEKFGTGSFNITAIFSQDGHFLRRFDTPYLLVLLDVHHDVHWFEHAEISQGSAGGARCHCGVLPRG